KSPVKVPHTGPRLPSPARPSITLHTIRHPPASAYTAMPIDIRSDTVTKPSPAMRRAIAEAEVGDDVLDGDPTTRKLEERVAALLGEERAVIIPSETMANQCASLTHCERGTELYADFGSHINDWELAGAAALAGVQVRTVHGEGPMMDAQALERCFR